MLTREVDTYFSLGIEFDNGKRLPCDDELIDSDPALFSSFYNLPCPAAPLKDLNEISSYFSIITSLFPRAFLLLSEELGSSLSDLFFLLLDRIAEATGRRGMTPNECFTHFGAFSSGLIAGRTLLYPYLPELIKYEMCLIKAGKPDLSLTSFQIDLNRIEDLKPLLNEKIIIEEFTFDIPNIILHAKSGRFVESCPREEETHHLIFRYFEEKSDVLEVSGFGVDFLRLSDGERTLDAIAELLYPKYGSGTGGAEFKSSCAQAARQLADLHLLVSGRAPDSNREGGEMDAAG